MSENEGLEYPEAQARDHIRSVSEAAVSAIPVVGSSVVELMEVLLAPSIGKRRDTWARELSSLIEELDAHQVTPEDLATDEDWISALFEASRAALGTHVELKLRMLRSLLTRMAIDKPRDSEQVIVRRFIRFVEELDEEHFLVLRYGSDPKAWFDAMGEQRGATPQSLGSRKAAFERAGLGLEGASRDIVLSDLDDRGLIQKGMLSGMTTSGASLDSFSTDLGDELIAWVMAFE